MHRGLAVAGKLSIVLEEFENYNHLIARPVNFAFGKDAPACEDADLSESPSTLLLVGYGRHIAPDQIDLSLIGKTRPL
jgi:hypothetical protein